VGCLVLKADAPALVALDVVGSPGNRLWFGQPVKWSITLRLYK
jgi:hypothetical protein